MTNTRFVLMIAVVGSMMLAGGCKSFSRSCNKTAAYAEAQDLQPLKIPAGLDSPDTRAALKIPELNEPEVPRGPKDRCLEDPPRVSATAAPAR
jgi:uncharacterized lipoprotein